MDIILEFLLLGAFAGVLLIGFMVLKAKKPHNTDYKIAMGLALAAAFLLFWVNGAVGIIGSSNNDANMMYIGVLATAFIGALLARFQPRGLARAMYTTAVAQVLVAVIAIAAGLGSQDPGGPWDIAALTSFYSALWVSSGVFFQKASDSEHYSSDTVAER